ncbi:hypothetical protein A6A04_04820 [Paramagnetospirillum marisnigri]|uniref:DUF454 domain-containing protein n=1 Tax=Paramagnetospirillum marisnigri TaxID=1285242 RepID=A0A178MHP4_9PROT|nr:YbaN family protein [Paramagnetospirillum marisnigri]OAN48083.1 hypothetical protein A6A04_04820 [Paramagnetospirillum marisnigri]
MLTGPARLALLGLGWVFFGLGMVGVFLPVMPTTPFMLVALWCFAKSSERFHAWLFHHRLFGPPLRQWERHRVIPLYAKLAALGSMAASMVYVIGFTETAWPLLAVMATSCTAGAVFILTKPSRVRDP